MKGKWVITRHFKKREFVEKAMDYLDDNNIPYERPKLLRSNVYSLSACFENCDDPEKAQYDFQDQFQFFTEES